MRILQIWKNKSIQITHETDMPDIVVKGLLILYNIVTLLIRDDWKSSGLKE